jgi:hypothetical protein
MIRTAERQDFIAIADALDGQQLGHGARGKIQSIGRIASFAAACDALALKGPPHLPAMHRRARLDSHAVQSTLRHSHVARSTLRGVRRRATKRRHTPSSSQSMKRQCEICGLGEPC